MFFVKLRLFLEMLLRTLRLCVTVFLSVTALLSLAGAGIAALIGLSPWAGLAAGGIGAATGCICYAVELTKKVLDSNPK